MHILLIEEPYRGLTACILLEQEESQSRYYDISQRVLSSTGVKFSDDPMELRMRAFPVQTDPLSENYLCCGVKRIPVILCPICD